VGLVLDPEIIARLGERGVDPGGRTMYDHEVRTVPKEQAVDHLHREVSSVPMSIAGHNHTHGSIISRSLRRGGINGA
jgi:hypothetical protein